MIRRRPHSARRTQDGDQYARAFVLLGLRVGKPSDPDTLDVRTPHGRREMHLPTLHRRIDELLDPTERQRLRTSDETLAMALAVLLGLHPPDDLLATPAPAAPFLRPRLVTRDAFTKAARTALRREAFDDVFYTVALGPLPNAFLVRTEHADRWGLAWESLFPKAVDALAARVTREHVHRVEDNENLLAVVHPIECVGCSHLVFESIVEGWERPMGMVFTLPTERTCLCMRVAPDVGAAGLARLVRTAYALTPVGSPDVRRGVYWAQADGVRSLAMTHIEDDEGARVQLDATGPVAELLRLLGEIQ